MYRFVFSGVDLCRSNLTNVAAVAMTNGETGNLAFLMTTVDRDRSSNSIDVHVFFNCMLHLH